MRIFVDFPIPPEFLLPGAWGVIRSRCSLLTQLLDFVVCSLLSLRNPYFDLKLRRKAARRFVEMCRADDVLAVATTYLAAARSWESIYCLGAGRRIVVTEVRSTDFHGRYFHAQRVLAMIERDLARRQLGDHA